MSHELMESVTYEEDGEEVTYATPITKGSPWKGKLIAGFRGEDQLKRAEEWMHHWSEASGNREKRERLMQLADLPMPAEQLSKYLDYSIPISQTELKGGGKMRDYRKRLKRKSHD